MSLEECVDTVVAWGFPRVSGDEPAGGQVGSHGQAFSPRERG